MASVAAAAAAVLKDKPAEWLPKVGMALGWTSSLLYVLSRLSQIRKTLQRRSAEGLATGMFLLAASANACTGSAILLRSFTAQQLSDQAPWLVGSFGTITLDCVIMWQSIAYSPKRAGAHVAAVEAAGSVTEPLLGA